jgi:hypothetical protein
MLRGVVPARPATQVWALVNRTPASAFAGATVDRPPGFGLFGFDPSRKFRWQRRSGGDSFRIQKGVREGAALPSLARLLRVRQGRVRRRPARPAPSGTPAGHEHAPAHTHPLFARWAGVHAH